MGGHWHDSTAGTQNQGNHIGDRSCVRQSKLYRQYESGNAVKDLLGSSHMKWDVNKKQGAYAGQKVYDHNTADHSKTLGQRGGARRNGAAKPAAPPSQFPQVGEFYGAEYAGAAPNSSAGTSILSHHAEPYRQDSLDEYQNQRQEHHSANQRHAHQGVAPQEQHCVPSQYPPPPPAHKNRRLEIEKQQQQAAASSEKHVFGNSTAASILKTRPW